MDRWMTRAAIVLLGGCGEALPPDAPSEEDEVLTAVSPRMIRRLNRAEVRRAYRDVLFIDRDLTADFPVDDASHGFDTVGEGLTVSPLWVELTEQIAALAVAAVVDKPLDAPIDTRLEVESEAFSSDAAYQGERDGAFVLYGGGSVTGEIAIPEDGTYRVSVRAWGDQLPPDPVLVGMRVGVEAERSFDVWGTGPDDADWLALEVPLRKGRYVLDLAFGNDALTDDGDRNAAFDVVRVEGPLDFVPRTNPSWDGVMTCDPTTASDPRACASEVVLATAKRAWRRPIADDEAAALMAVYDAVVAEGDPALWGVEFALRAVFASPHFLFLVEPPADAPLEPLDPHALAARLSFMLWSSVPDDTLLALADSGELADTEVLRAQVRRMLQDPKAEALSEEFAAQWLMIRALADAQPDFWTFPSFTEDLRQSMRASMVMQFGDLLDPDTPVTDLVLSETAWLDGPLAALYGLRGIRPDGFERIDVGSYGRRGWLTTAGLLTATSYPTRTSPVRRGVWVLSQLLCDEPDPPPPGVEGFPEPSPNVRTVRERLEEHRKIPSCAGCHNQIDPVGLAFEKFGGIGIQREVDDGFPVDASGVLPDGTEVDGVIDLAEAVAADPRFTVCVVDKVFTYAHGRAPTEDDAPYLDAIHEAFLADGGSLTALFEALVTSPSFRLQGGAP